MRWRWAHLAWMHAPPSPSPVDQPRPPPALRRRAVPAAVESVPSRPASPRRSAILLPPPPPGPPPPGAVRLWTDVVRAPSSSEEPARRVAPGPAPGPDFAVPFNSPGMAHAQMVHALEEPVEACFLEASDDIWRMEEELARAVLVTVTGMRPAVDLASAAEALHSEFGIGLDDMSIRAFYPEDFLVLCHDGAVRERMVRAGKVTASWFELKLRPWLRQAQATAAHLPFLVPVSLRGVPAHAWCRRTADVILRGLGYVVGVDESTARRHDMADFRVWLRTDRPKKIPRRRLLFINEPRRNLWDGAVDGQVSVGKCSMALWYPIGITVLGEPLQVDSGGLDAPPPPPPPPPPSPPSGGDDLEPGAGGGRPAVQGARGHDGSGDSGGAAASTAGSSTAAPPPARKALIQTASDAGAGRVSSSCVAVVAGPASGLAPCQKVGTGSFQRIGCDQVQPRVATGQVEGVESSVSPATPRPLVGQDGIPRQRLQMVEPASSQASVQLPRWHSRSGAAVSDRMGAECDEARDLGDCSSSPSSGGTVRVRSFLLDAPGISEDDMIAFPRGTGTGQISPCESFQVSLSAASSTPDRLPDVEISCMPHAENARAEEVDAQATVPATDVVSGTPLLLGDVAASVQASVATMCDELRVSLSPILPRPDSRAPAGMGANQRKEEG
ncbi:hypothetical protein VPH35_138456 [Triticum aestivum]